MRTFQGSTLTKKGRLLSCDSIRDGTFHSDRQHITDSRRVSLGWRCIAHAGTLCAFCKFAMCGWQRLGRCRQSKLDTRGCLSLYRHCSCTGHAHRQTRLHMMSSCAKSKTGTCQLGSWHKPGWRRQCPETMCTGLGHTCAWSCKQCWYGWSSPDRCHQRTLSRRGWQSLSHRRIHMCPCHKRSMASRILGCDSFLICNCRYYTECMFDLR